MTTRHKDFGAPRADVEVEPLSFSLHGEEFDCHPNVQGAMLLRFIKEADSGDGSRASEALLGLFEKVLEPESFVRFNELWNDNNRIVPIETIGEIAGWLIEEYTARPTKRSSSSSRGRTRPGRTSTETVQDEE